MARFLQVLLGTSLLVGCGGVAKADPALFLFNPADFFNFKHYSEGGSTEGGMFRLHQTGGLTGSPVYDSWIDTEWPTLDAMRTSLDDSPDDEGIGYVQAFILKSPDPNAPVTVLGQTLTANPSVAPTGTAPTGWSTLGASESASAWVYQWEADSADYYIRPSEDFGLFSLEFDAHEPVTFGSNYTFWFGGDNFPGFVPGISFGTFPGGFPSEHSEYEIGTAYEATLGLTAVPEPTTFLGLLELGLIAAIAAGWRRRRQR